MLHYKQQNQTNTRAHKVIHIIKKLHLDYLCVSFLAFV